MIQYPLYPHEEWDNTNDPEDDPDYEPGEYEADEWDDLVAETGIFDFLT